MTQKERIQEALKQIVNKTPISDIQDAYQQASTAHGESQNAKEYGGMRDDSISENEWYSYGEILDSIACFLANIAHWSDNNAS